MSSIFNPTLEEQLRQQMIAKQKELDRMIEAKKLKEIIKSAETYVATHAWHPGSSTADTTEPSPSTTAELTPGGHISVTGTITGASSWAISPPITPKFIYPYPSGEMLLKTMEEVWQEDKNVEYNLTAIYIRLMQRMVIQYDGHDFIGKFTHE